MPTPKRLRIFNLMFKSNSRSSPYYISYLRNWHFHPSNCSGKMSWSHPWLLSFFHTSYLINGQIIIAPPSECSHNPTIFHIHSYDPLPNHHISCLHLCNMQRPPAPQSSTVSILLPNLLLPPSASCSPIFHRQHPAPRSFIYIAAVLVVLFKVGGYISFLFWKPYNGFPSQ